MRPLLPIISPMPGHTTTVGTSLSGIKPLEIQSVDDAFEGGAGKSVAHTNSFLPQDWQKNLTSWSLGNGACETAQTNRRIIERVIKSNHFSDRQKAFYYHLGTKTTNEGEFTSLYDVFRVARKHPHNRYWIDPIISERVPYKQLFTKERSSLPYKEDSSWVFARKEVFESLGVDPNRGEQAGNVSHVKPEWQKIMLMIGDHYATYLSLFSEYKEPFYFMMEQWLKNGFGPLPEKWLHVIAEKIVGYDSGMDKKILSHQRMSVRFLDSWFVSYPRLKEAVKAFLINKAHRVFADDEAPSAKMTHDKLLKLFSRNNDFVLPDNNGTVELNGVINNLDEYPFVLGTKFYYALIRSLSSGLIPNEYQVRIITYVYKNSEKFRKWFEVNIPRLPHGRWDTQWLYYCLEDNSELPPIQLLTSDDIIKVVNSMCALMEDQDYRWRESIVYALESKGYFPGSLEALPRQSFGAMMLLKRLPIDLARIGTDKRPQSQTQPLEDDKEPQYLKVVHTFTRLMEQGSQTSLDARFYYDVPYKGPYWPKPADEKTITITMERSHGNGEPRFIPFVRHASINGDLFDTTFMDQKTNNMTPSLRLQSAPGEPEIWHARHFGLPAVATGGAYGFEMAQGAQASVLFQYYQDEVEKASEIMGDAQIKSVLSRERLWPWLEKVLKVYAQKQGWVHPRVVFKKDYKKWIEAIEEVIKENFAYRKDMSSDLLHEVFEAGWDFSEQQLWQHCHHPRRVPTGKLAIGSDVEQSMIAIELMRFFGISCDYAFGIRLPNPFFYQQSTTIRTALVCQPLVRGKHAPGYVRDYRIALLQTQGDAEEPKVSNKQKTPLEQLKKGSRTWLRRLASAAVLAGGLVLMKSCVDYIPKIPLPLVDDDSANGFDIDLSKYLDFFKNSGVALLGNGERKPHTQPYPGDEGNPWRDGGFEKKQAVYTVDVGPLVSLPDYLGVGFSYDYSGRDSLEAYFLEGMEQTLVEHIFDRSWLEVEPTQAFVAMLSQVDEPRPMIGDRRRNQTYLIPEDSVKPYYQRNHEQSGNPEISDERLLEVAVPLSTISQNYDLSEAQSLSFEERIDWVKAQIAENMIYDRKPNLDPVHVDFVRDWDVDDSEQLIEYWEHIHSPERVLESKHPGQCLEIGFTAVQLGRALDIPMIYSSGYLVHSESESSGYTGLPHAQPLIVWQDASGQERMYPMMLPTEDFTRLSGEQNGQGIPKTNYTLILFSMLLVYWTERRRLKKRNEASYVLSRLLGQGDEKEETSLADINKVYQKLLREIPDDDFMPLHLQHSGFRAPKSTDAAVFKEAMIFMAQVTRDRPRGRDEPSLSDWDNFLRASFNTGTWNYSGNSNPPLFDEETLAARIQKRMIGYAEKLQILLNDTDHGLSDEAQALVSEVLTMFLSDERPEIDVVFDDLR